MQRDNGHDTPRPETETEETLNEWDNLLFSVRRSIRYHSKRAAWFEFWYKFATATAIFFSASSVAALIKQWGDVAIAASIFVAFFSTISLVFGWSQKERLHTDLKRKFIELEKNMSKCLNPDSRILAEMTAERLSIEEYEPKVVEVLNVICHNELCIAQGYGKIYKVGWLRDMLCHLNPPIKNPEVEKEIVFA